MGVHRALPPGASFSRAGFIGASVAGRTTPEALRMGASFLVWGVFLRTVLVWHITWSVNSLPMSGVPNVTTPATPAGIICLSATSAMAKGGTTTTMPIHARPPWPPLVGTGRDLAYHPPARGGRPCPPDRAAPGEPGGGPGREIITRERAITAPTDRRRAAAGTGPVSSRCAKRLYRPAPIGYSTASSRTTLGRKRPMLQLNRDDLLRAYRQMKTIREFEERVMSNSPMAPSPASCISMPARKPQRRRRLPCICARADHIASTHRGHGHARQGLRRRRHVSEIFGKATGCATARAARCTSPTSTRA